MPQEPRSFFERLTGARVLGRENESAVEYNRPTQTAYQPEIANEDVGSAIEETEVEMDDNFTDETTSQPSSGYEEQEGQLTVDVFQDDENIVIQSTIAGVSPDDLDVSITNDMVTIRGERRRQYNADQEDYFYQECYWGTFSRSIILPVEIDADRAEAKIKNGILTIRIPKANTAVTRKLKVKAT
ncbi:MAG: Hsp20/alpha crystallin family protein [Candidatus Andersenbacteria bacterium]|nr:Hsp20/alpha crystallin family protein [Candidatus Andersenbacteria bacterium]